MPAKKKLLEGIGTVTFTPYKKSRSIRIHINGSQIKVTYPRSMPYSLAKKYVISKENWILKHKKQAPLFTSGDLIGKKHKLRVMETSNRSTRSTKTKEELILNLPLDKSIDNEEVQMYVTKKVEGILKEECHELITPLLIETAFEKNVNYSSISYKKLKRRWGSCDSKKNLVFNIYLVQLPWDLIKYVLIHELAHTIHLNHSDRFWDQVKYWDPEYKKHKRELRTFPPESTVH